MIVPWCWERISQWRSALSNGKNYEIYAANFVCSSLRYYRKNTALIEIYYEQLNYEKLKETPGYTVFSIYFLLFCIPHF
jgi:hypothetical protein